MIQSIARTLETVVLFLVLVAFALGASQALPAVAEALQEQLSKAANVK